MSIHDKSLLVSLALSGIASTRADKTITREVLRDHNAEADAGRWLSRLWPKEALEPIRSLDSKIRAYHYERTLPWLDKGERIIPARAFSDYADKMRGFRHERETAVRTFLDHYDDWIDKARTMRGTSFNAREYPDYYQAESRFRMEVHSAPIPHRDDFRIRLAETDMNEVQDEIETRVERATRDAEQALYRRIAEPVSALCEKLADPEAKLTEASLNALRTLVAVLPDINAFDDPLIDQIRDQIEAKLCRLDPEGIKTSRSDRSIALASANDILSKMAPWLDIPELESGEDAA